MKMKGKLINLRALEPSDVQLLYRWENSPEVWTISGTLKPFSQYTLKQFVAASVKDIYESKQWRLIIDENETGETVGIIDIFEFDPLHEHAGIGILIADGHRRRGYAEEAILLVKDYLFEILHLRQIYCNVMANNEASLQLFQKCGFSICGLKKDWIRTRNGWEDEYMLQIINNITS